MPAVTRSRPSKHVQTPYTRPQKKSKQEDTDLEVQNTQNRGLFGTATASLVNLVTWVFSGADELTGRARKTASKIVHKDIPERSLTSQLEDGTLGNPAARSDSLLAADLVPHYLGKTPKPARQGLRANAQPVTTNFKVPMFDSAQFKIPAMPTPQPDERVYKNLSTKLSHANGSTGRGRSLKALEISSDTFSRHDNEILSWLNTQNLDPQDLASAQDIGKITVDDTDKLQQILNDNGFFRRRGLPPPQSHTERERAQSESVNDFASNTNPRRDRSHSIARSLTHLESEPSSTTLRGQPVDIRNWKNRSNTGILSAWREICRQQDVRAQAQSLTVAIPQSKADSVRSSQRDTMLWQDTKSFSDKPSGSVNRNEHDSQHIESGQLESKYWGPVRSFPVPATSTMNTDLPKIGRVISQGLPKHRRSHSRQMSLSRRGRLPSEQAASRTSRATRQRTPSSAVSSRHSSRRPRESSNQRRESVSRAPTPVKPKMVDMEVQTTDDLFEALEKEDMADVQPIVISKDRRKRAGCFSALDEDMEDLFGPYSDIPVKKAKLFDDFNALSHPRVPLLREDNEIKLLRAQREQERIKTTPIELTAAIEPQTVQGLQTSKIDTLPLGQSMSVGQAETSTYDLFGRSNHSKDQPALEEPQTSLPTVHGGTSDTSKNFPMFSVPSHKGIDSSSEQASEAQAAAQPSSIPKFDFKPAKLNEMSNDHSTQPDKFTKPVFEFKSVPTSKTEDKIKPSHSFFNPQIPDTSNTPGLSKQAPSTDFEPSVHKQTNDESHKLTAAQNSEKQSEELAKPVFSFVKASDQSFPKFGDGTATQGQQSGNSSGFNFPMTTASNGFAGFAQSNKLTNLDHKEEPATTASPKAETPFAFKPSTTFNFGSTGNAFGAVKPSEQPSTISILPTKPLPEAGQVLSGSKEQPSFFPTSKSIGNDGPAFSFGQKASSTSTLQQPTNSQGTFEFGNGKPQSSSGFASNAVTSLSNGFGSSSAPANGFQENIQNLAGSVASPFTFPSSKDTSNSDVGHSNTTLNTTSQPVVSVGQPNKINFGAAFSQPTSNFSSNAQANIVPGAQPAAPVFSFGTNNSAPAPAPPTFTFGSSQATNKVQQASAPVNSFSFGSAPAPVAAGPPSFTFGGAQTQPQIMPSFGSQENQASQPSFSFGTQSNTAPNSGFASPLVGSPSIQSATAPGSPNPFDFNAGGTAAGQAGGQRKILQPRSRRPRGNGR